MKTTRKIIITMLCALCIILGTSYFLGMAYFQTHFKIGTAINGFHCAFKTVDEAEALLSKEVSSYAIAIDTRNGGVEKLTAKDVGMTFNGKEGLVDIINNQDYRLWFMPEIKEHNLDEESYAIDSAKIQKAIAKLKCMHNMVSPESARIVDTDGFYQVAQQVVGTELDREKAKQVIETSIRQWHKSVNLEDKGCYKEAEKTDEKELQKQCDFLNSIKDVIITYDFGDRKETVDVETIRKNMLSKDFKLSQKKIEEYVKSLAEKYDTIGNERSFVTYDNRTSSISGGDYGWQIDIKKTAQDLKQMITDKTIDVVNPTYSQSTVSKNSDDIGHSYLEIDKSHGSVVLYVDGNPVVQCQARFGTDISSGFYRLKLREAAAEDGTKNIMYFGDGAVYQFDDAAAMPGFSGNEDISATATSNGVKQGCIAVDETSMNTIFTTFQDNWPIIVYDDSNITGQTTQGTE